MSKTVFLQPGTHCLVPVHASIVEQIKALKYVSPVVAVEIGYNRAIDEAVEILEKVRAINPTESNDAPADHKAFFEKYKGVTYLGEHGKLRMMADSEPTEEERYQAYEARILAKLQQERVKDWGLDK